MLSSTLLNDPPPCIGLYIFGNPAFAAIADEAADSDVPEKAITRSRLADIIAPFMALENASGKPINVAGVIGFSVSGDLKIADVVMAGQALDAGRANEAFALAEA